MATVTTHNRLGRALRARLLGDAAWALLGQVGSGLLLLLGTRVLTEQVSPATYGQVALLNGAVALGVCLFAYPYISAGIRLWPEAQSLGEGEALNRAVGGLILRSAALALLLLALVSGAAVALGGADPWLYAAAGLLFAMTVGREAGVQGLIGQRRQRAATLWQTGDSLLRPGCAIGLVWLAGTDASLVLLGYALAGAVANLGGGLACATGQRGGTCGKDWRREILAYAWPLIPMEFLAWFGSLGDRYVIGYLMTAQDVGLYAAAYTLVNEAFHRSATVLLRVFQPVYFQHCAAGDAARAGRVYSAWLLCVLGMGATGALALHFLKDQVCALLLAGAYRPAAVLMPVIGLGCALQALGTLMAQPLYARKQTRVLLLGRVCGTVAALAALPLMVRWQGLLGAALAAPVYFGIEALALALLARPWSLRQSLVRCPLPVGEGA
jgi:O-antigen/teichoic acid export membrane protein